MSHVYTWGAPFVVAPGPTTAPTRAPGGHLTHEAFCHRVRSLAVARIREEVTENLLLGAKLVYGIGSGAYRGVCHYGAWHAAGQATAMIEIAATGEESALQLAGTTIHETAHVLSPGGHGAGWKQACKRLGLCGPKGLAEAADQAYAPEHFEEALWREIEALGEPGDGTPQFRGQMGGMPVLTTHTAPCPMGRGTRGGKSFGPGSGRLRLWECRCERPVKVRVASDDFQAHCDRCGEAFAYQGSR